MTTPADLVVAPAGPGLAARARRSRLGIVAVALLAAIVALMLLGSRGGDVVPLSTENSRSTGTRAVAQILRDHGVDVRQVDRLAQARIADPAATTVVIATPYLLGARQLESLAEYPGDVVLLGASDESLAALGVPATDELIAIPRTVEAGCSDPDALAAGTVRVADEGLAATGDGVELCFLHGGTAGFGRAEVGGRTVTVIASSTLVTNDQLDELGHAALALRALGRQPEVLWYVADGFDSSLLTWGADGSRPTGETPGEFEPVPDFLPPGTGTALYALALTVLVAAVWKARRFGALVAEPLPVVVRASEATRGRARLYRKARATGRAAASLRAAAAMRMGRRIGVPRSEARETLVAAIARASGRPAQDVDRLLYGPPPADDAALLTLMSELDALESEVHRP
ncbi:DUF4350 domain-containing protein [Demequina subtropica]|uniref:DUF4350 domain-containing protein n=1 Tax=Demequina subtropica TaxID=1638989 RepID=UPI0007857AC5|nr:DUF4350 domain-containing protein [Demequina subtropica]